MMGCCPMGAPGDGGEVVPRSVLRLPHLPGCSTIAQGCHPLKKTVSGEDEYLGLHPRMQDSTSSESGHLCTPLGLPWTWPGALRSGVSWRGSDRDEPHTKASSGELC